MASIHSDVVVITGGGLGDNLRIGWLATVVSRDDKKFISADKADTKFAKFVSQDFDMTDAIICARNRATDVLMRRAEAARDPMSEMAEVATLKRSRKEMLDEIDAAIQITVKLASGGEHTLWVLTACSSRHKLCIELTEENVAVLLKSPADADVEPDKAQPDVNEANVRWMASRHAVYCRYYDGAAKKWRVKIMRVDGASGGQRGVDKMATVCQSFYDLHHTDPTVDGRGIQGALNV